MYHTVCRISLIVNVSVCVCVCLFVSLPAQLGVEPGLQGEGVSRTRGVAEAVGLWGVTVQGRLRVGLQQGRLHGRVAVEAAQRGGGGGGGEGRDPGKG